MYPSRLDGFEFQTGPLDKLSFHTAFASDPQDLVIVLIQLFGNGQRRIHSAASPACANQQLHWFDSFLEFLSPLPGGQY